jgi:hypothetical protein
MHSKAFPMKIEIETKKHNNLQARKTKLIKSVASRCVKNYFSSKLINNIELHRISRLLTGTLKLCWLILFVRFFFSEHLLYRIYN